jgi:hydrogenase maturation protease
MTHASVLVLCLGNPLRRDDAMALHVAEAVERLALPGVEVRRSARAGLYLLDDMEGFDRVVVVDAIRTQGGVPGTIHSLPLEAIHSPGGPSPHAIGLPSAIAAARAAGAPVPDLIHVVAMEVVELEEIGEGLTPAVAGAVPRAVKAVREAIALVAASGRVVPHGV